MPLFPYMVIQTIVLGMALLWAAMDSPLSQGPLLWRHNDMTAIVSRHTCGRVLSYKTCLDTKPVVPRQVLHLLSKLQNWISLKTGQYKTCIVSNTKIEASIRATKPKPWQSHITFETVRIFIQNEKAGLGSAQSRFWSRHKAGFGAVGLGLAQSRFWSGKFRDGTKLVLKQAQSRNKHRQ